MKMWGYYAWHTFFNSIRKFFRSKVIAGIVAALLLIGVFGTVLGMVFVVLIPEESTEEVMTGSEVASGTEGTPTGTEATNESAASGTGTADGEIDPADTNNPDQITEEDIALVKIWVEAGLELVLLVILLSGLYSGSKKGSDIFQMADVNFLFTAPLKPQTVLMFRMSFQMAAALFGSVYLIFQIPNLMLNLHLSGYVVVIVFLAWILLLILQKIVSVWSYTLVASHPRLQNYVLPAMLAVVGIFAAVTGCVYLAVGGDVMKTVETLYTSEWSRWLPLIGWFKAMVMTAVNGEIGRSLLFFALLLGGMAAMIWGIWQMKADFYEDAFTGAQVRDELAHPAENAGAAAVTVKTGKKRSEKIKRNTDLKGNGASVFFWKEMFNRKRFNLFGFCTRTMRFYLLLAFLLSFGTWKATGTAQFLVVGLLTAGILFFRNYGNPIATETSMNWLFLTPDEPYKKVFYAMIAGTASCAMDLAPALILAAVWAKLSPLMLLLWFITLVTMDFMLSASGLLLEAIFPASALDSLKVILQLTLKFIVLALIAIVFAVGFLVNGVALGLAFVFALNIVLGTLGFIVYPLRMHGGIG